MDVKLACDPTRTLQAVAYYIVARVLLARAVKPAVY